MGEILESRFLSAEKVKIKICLDKEEAYALRGHIDNINLIAKDSSPHYSRIVQRGKEGISKYFTIPPGLIEESIQPIDEVNCHRIETGKRLLFIYIYSKDEEDRGL